MVDSGVPTYYAVTVINGSVSGTVKFIQQAGQKVRIQAEINGLTPGLHGFHIHEWGNLTNGCVTAGPHYNPHGKTHAGPSDEVRHVGDLGNIEANAEGRAVLDIEDHLINIYGDVANVVGRSVVVHAGVDDLGKGGNEESLKTGNAGARVGCGVIGLSGPLELSKF